MSLFSLHCFAGIGGGMLADKLHGFTPIATVEWDKNCQKVLELRWPGVTRYGDIREFNEKFADDYAKRVDLICGGWPCQDISVAGLQRGMEYGSNTRSSLAFEFLKTVHRIRPRLVFAENVSNILSPKHRKGLDQMLGELEHMGYGGGYIVTTARSSGAHHIRKRFWLLAVRGRKGFKDFGRKDGRRGAPALPTPRVGGGGTFVFTRADGKTRDDLETVCFMRAMERELGIDIRDMTPGNVEHHLAGRRISAGFVERLMRFPVGYTDLRVPGEVHEFNPPYESFASLMAHDPLQVPKRSDNRTARLKQLGNAQDPVQAYHAFIDLTNLLQIQI